MIKLGGGYLTKFSLIQKKDKNGKLQPVDKNKVKSV